MRLAKELEKQVQKLEKTTNDHIRTSKSERDKLEKKLMDEHAKLYKLHIDRHIQQQNALDKLAEKDKAQDAWMVKDNTRIVDVVNKHKTHADKRFEALESQLQALAKQQTSELTRVVDGFNKRIEYIYKELDKLAAKA